jgi:hypothetical protein
MSGLFWVANVEEPGLGGIWKECVNDEILNFAEHWPTLEQQPLLSISGTTIVYNIFADIYRWKLTSNNNTVFIHCIIIVNSMLFGISKLCIL